MRQLTTTPHFPTTMPTNTGPARTNAPTMAKARRKQATSSTALVDPLLLLLLLLLSISYQYLTTHPTQVMSVLGDKRARAYTSFESFYSGLYR